MKAACEIFWILAAADGQRSTLEQQANLFFGKYLVDPLARIFFWDVPWLGMPLVVVWLLGAATYPLP